MIKSMSNKSERNSVNVGDIVEDAEGFTNEVVEIVNINNSFTNYEEKQYVEFESGDCELISEVKIYKTNKDTKHRY